MTRPAPSSHRIAALLLALAALLLGVPDAHADPGWRWPVEGELLTAYRNGDDPYAAGQHRGIDIAAPVGARVVAATGGTVAFAGTAGDSGVTVSIRTAGGRFDTAYLHLASASVRRGQRVSAGDRIGSVGTTGRRSVAEAHLHFGVREAGSRHAYLDPLTLLPPPTAPGERPAPPRAVPVAVPQPLAPGPALAAADAAAAVPALAPGAAAVPALAPGAAAVPALAPGPALPAPAPAAASVPAPAPGPAHASRAVPVPATAGLDASASSPTALPSRRTSASTSASGLARAGALARASAPGNPSPARVDAARAGGPAELGPAPRRSQAAQALQHRIAPRPPAARDAARSGGLDLGWFAACAGMVAAALMLGRPRGPAAALRAARRLSHERNGGAEPRRPAGSIAT